jgi:type VI secretion system protein ImpF
MGPTAMADKTISERLQPSLLDRLTDTAPDTPSERRDDRVIDVRRLREIISRDLAFLLNCSNAETVIDPDRYPHASNSVLNYGMREVSGTFSTVERVGRIRSSIARAIARFEPRIKPGTLDVTARAKDTSARSTVVFDIRADMWAQPIPMELYLRSEVDVTTGQVTLERKA